MLLRKVGKKKSLDLREQQNYETYSKKHLLLKVEMKMRKLIKIKNHTKLEQIKEI